MVIATHFKTSNANIKISTQITTQKTKTRTTAGILARVGIITTDSFNPQKENQQSLWKSNFFAKLQKTEEK